MNAVPNKGMWMCEQVSTPEAAIYLPRRHPLHRSTTTSPSIQTQQQQFLRYIHKTSPCRPAAGLHTTLYNMQSGISGANCPCSINSKLTNLLYSLPGTPRCLHHLHQRLLPLLPPHNHHLRKPDSSIPNSFLILLVRILLPFPLQPLLHPQTPDPHLPPPPP